MAIKFVTPVVVLYRIECPYCGHRDNIYGIPMTMTVKCTACKRKLTLISPMHNMVKAGRERG